MLPGGHKLSVALHQARVKCRELERYLCELAVQEELRRPLIEPVNRLSDLLFVLSRAAVVWMGLAEENWQGVRG